ncbi:MAG: polysaccharide biosynthesis/export family protein [Planctomycetota bacterium]
MTKRGIIWVFIACLFVGFSGCYNDVLDPTAQGRFEPTPTVNVILNTLGVSDEPPPTYTGAEEPRPEDLLPYEPDYVFSAGDVIQISIFELYNEGQQYVNQFIVTESGRISIPDVGTVTVEGLTEAELEREIVTILSPNIIKHPSVIVTLLNSERRLFSIVGQGVAQSARFQLPRYPIRLTDAIALAGGVGDFNVEYIYVSRDVKIEELPTFEMQQDFDSKPVEPKQKSAEDEMLEMITPSTHPDDRLITTAEMGTRDEFDPLDEFSDELDTAGDISPNPTASRIEWIFEDGKWKAIEADSEGIEIAVLQPDLLEPGQFASERKKTEPLIPSEFGLSDISESDTVTRVIQIPVDRLLAGDPRYNIVVRPADRITVPRDLVGEFYVAGNVNAPNAYPITGRPITLKQAITIAGGLGPIAWPQKVEVVRRIGKNKAGLMQEEIVLVDYKKIMDGTLPDFFIKQHDYINVGTHGTARWLAALRNAFFANYGFGLSYNRNFAYDDFGDNPINLSPF